MYHLDHDSLRFLPDNDYPIDIFKDEIIEEKLRPRQISRSLIENKVNDIIKYLNNGTITLLQAKVYLRYIGINNEVQKYILNNYNIINKYELPSAWYKTDDVSIFVDVPMHLLMLGVVKSVMLKIGSCLRLANQNANFIRMTTGILGIIKKMNIEWCKVLEYPTTDTTGGWVSENFLGIARLGNWFYSLIEYLPFPEKYTEPTIEINKWTKQQCEKWLQVRGLSKAGNGMDLKKQIIEYKNNNNSTEILKKNIINKYDILDLVYSTCLLIKKLMSKNTSINDINHVEAVIRMFLITYDKVDKLVNDSNVPAWIKQYNMLCLLNLPNMMKKYGSIRNLWEGGLDGESYLKMVKGQLKAGLVNGWQTWVITNLLKEKVYKEWDNKVSNRKNIRSEARIYGNYKIAANAFQHGMPISAITHNNKIYIGYRNKGKIKGTEIKLQNKEELKYGNTYYSISLIKSSVTLDEYDENYVGMLLLPKLCDNGYATVDDNLKYCCILSDWS